jgi:hypothetical protein
MHSYLHKILFLKKKWVLQRRQRPVARLTWRGADRRRRRQHGARTTVGASLGQPGGGFGPGEHAVETARAGRGDGADSGARSGGLSGRRRAVPTAPLRRASGAARGSHAAMARCQAGLTRRTASDRWDPLISIFRIKNPPDENSSK